MHHEAAVILAVPGSGCVVFVHALKKRDRHIFPGPTTMWSYHGYVSLTFSRGKNESVPAWSDETVGRQEVNLFSKHTSVRPMVSSDEACLKLVAASRRTSKARGGFRPWMPFLKN